jgi:hypothetical protein
MVFRDGDVEQRNDATIGNAVEPVEDEEDIPPRRRYIMSNENPY